MAERHNRAPGAGELLTRGAAHELGAAIVAEAERLSQCSMGLYVVDVSGRWLRRVTGAGRCPPELAIPMAVGPELPRRRAEEVQRRVAADHPGLVVHPLWLRDRAVGVLVSDGPPAASLDELAHEAAAAIELADGYGDMFEGPRRRAPMSAASELQENLLPARIVEAPGAEIAASVLPAYEVGGDWFDLTVTPGGALVIAADAVGKGPRAAALSALTVGAERAVRRRGGALEDMAAEMHDAIRALGQENLFVTAVLAEWRAEGGEISWLTCGHPPPLRIGADGGVEELEGPRSAPLGLSQATDRLERGRATLEAGDVFVLYSDGVTERRDEAGEPLGLKGVVEAVASLEPRSATDVELAIQNCVADATDAPLRDDATVVALGRRVGD